MTDQGLYNLQQSTVGALRYIKTIFNRGLCCLGSKEEEDLVKYVGNTVNDRIKDVLAIHNEIIHLRETEVPTDEILYKLRLYIEHHLNYIKKVTDMAKAINDDSVETLDGWIGRIEKLIEDNL